jgi:hypothetical protein
MSDAEIKPLKMMWDGACLWPVKAAAKLASEQYAIGETYFMDIVRARSKVTHDHFFATVEEAWQNSSDEAQERFPTSDHLRKYALIKAGYCDVDSLVCSSRAEALRVATFMRRYDEYALIVVSQAVVSRYTAKSQSFKAMGGKVFQESKAAVLAVLAELLEVTPRELMGASV